jgi:hypothetical protein
MSHSFMSRQALLPIACLVMLLALVFTGTKVFTLNGQAWFMWDNFGHDPLLSLFSGHEHGLRYLAYYPVFAAADAFGISADLVFSYFCAGLLFLMALLLRRVVSALWGSAEHHLSGDVTTVAIFAMSLLMNGRLILAFFGYLLVIVVAVDWFKNRRWNLAHSLGLALALIMVGVSSGTLVIAMALVAGIVLVTLLRDPLLARFIQMPVSIIVILILFASPTALGLAKNLDYYGGDGWAVVNMLEHGAGGDIIASLHAPVPTDDNPSDAVPNDTVLGIVQFWWVAVLACAIVAWFRGWRPIRMVRTSTPQENMVQFSIVLTLLGGLFAYSVLSMSIIPLMILGSGYAVHWPGRANESFSG